MIWRLVHFETYPSRIGLFSADIAAAEESAKLRQLDVTSNPSLFNLFTETEVSAAERGRTVGQQDVPSPEAYELATIAQVIVAVEAARTIACIGPCSPRRRRDSHSGLRGAWRAKENGYSSGWPKLADLGVGRFRSKDDGL